MDRRMKVMTIWCNFEGDFGMGAFYETETRTFTNSGQEVKATYTLLGESATAETVVINLSPDPLTSESWETYSATITLDPSLVDSGVAAEIFESIR